MDGLTDGPTDRRTDIPEYKDTRTLVKIRNTKLLVVVVHHLKCLLVVREKATPNVVAKLLHMNHEVNLRCLG